MTLKWVEGGESHITGTDFARLYQSGGAGAASITNPRVPPGLRAFTVGSSDPLVTPSLGVQNTWIVSIGQTLGSATEPLWSFKLAGVEQCRLQRVFDSGTLFKLAIYRGATEVAITTETFDSALWNFFELKVTVRDGTDGAYELRHNEVNIASLTDTGVDLADTGGDGCDVHGFGASGRNDDVFILDDQGADNNDFLGDSAVYEVLPDGDGDVLDWTPSTGVTHFDLVNALSENVQSDTNGHKDLYDYAALPTTGLGAIFGLIVLTTAQMDAIGSRTLKAKYRNAADAEGDGPSFVVSGTPSSDYPVVMEQNPIAAAAWTKSDIDDGQFGLEVVS